MVDDIFVIDGSTEESTSNNKYILIDSEADFIQENVFVKELVLSDDGKWFQIICEKDGLEVSTQRQYFPDPAKKDEPTYPKVVSIKKGLLTNFLRRFAGENANVKATSWVEFVQRVDMMCKPRYKTTPLRVKLELVEGRNDYAGKYYTNISTFAPFENMTTAKSKLFVGKKDKQLLEFKLNEDRVAPDSDTSIGTDSEIAATF